MLLTLEKMHHLGIFRSHEKEKNEYLGWSLFSSIAQQFRQTKSLMDYSVLRRSTGTMSLLNNGFAKGHCFNRGIHHKNVSNRKKMNKAKLKSRKKGKKYDLLKK